MKNYFTLLLLFSFSHLSFCSDDPGPVTGHLKKKSGETINLYKTVSIDDYNDVSYTNENNKWTKIKGKEVVWIESPGTIYISQPDEKKKKYNLRELITINEKYKMFMSSWGGQNGISTSVYIYDMDDNIVENFYSSSASPKFIKQKTETVDGVEKYFGECNDLISLLRNNIPGKKDYLYKNLKYTSCPGSPERSVFLK